MFNEIRVGTGRSKPKALIVGQFKGASLDKPQDHDPAAVAASKRPEATGDVGRIVEAFPDAGAERVLIVGLGDKDTFDAGRLRAVGGYVARRLSNAEATPAEIDLSGPLKAAKADAWRAGSAFGEGLGLASWSYDTLRGSATTLEKGGKLEVRTADRAFASGLERGLGLATSTNACRDLSQTPPNIATPSYIANEAKKLARQTGMTCTVISGKKLEDERLTGLINVGKASENAPCLIRLEYQPASRARSKKKTSSRSGKRPVVLLGKTMTYDSGGLSIKVGGGMKGMKRDKDGGCAVFGAMHAIATVIKPRVPVVGLMVAAENSISDEAYRPDDVLTFRNGVTVEVTNTDAEGRLVLADGLCWACEKENPAAIIDLATLTGGVVVALGSTYAGMWCDDDDLREKLERASDTSGERLWRLPHHDEYRSMMKSPIADIVNSAPVREAHPIQGAAFLSYFCEAGIPWAHIDIAGVHATEKDKAPIAPGPTGFGVRLLAEYFEG